MISVEEAFRLKDKKHLSRSEEFELMQIWYAMGGSVNYPPINYLDCPYPMGEEHEVQIKYKGLFDTEKMVNA
jgi:hypothetical protein